jgi:hypothetical protein
MCQGFFQHPAAAAEPVEIVAEPPDPIGLGQVGLTLQGPRVGQVIETQVGRQVGLIVAAIIAALLAALLGL